MLSAEGKDLGIRNAWVHVGHIPDRVALFSQKGRDLPFHTLVANESHAASVGDG